MQGKFHQISYQSGRDITERLKTITHVREFQDLADAFNIPRSTISTWHTRNITPYEVIVRTCLISGCSLKWLALGEGEAFEQTTDPSIKKITIKKISNGLLESNGVIFLDLVTLEKYGLEGSNTTVVEQDGNLHFVNTLETNPASGRYLIDIDGSISINHLQRLPGKKLAMSFGDSSIEITQKDIEVIGRIVMVIEKE